MTPAAPNHEQRVLILAPLGRDAKLACEVLTQAGLDAEACADIHKLCAALHEGCGVVLIAEEALTPEAQKCLSDALASQPPWSDLPIVIFASKVDGPGSTRRMEQLLDVLGNVTFIERPVRVPTLVTAMKAALRARRRQYTARTTLQTMERQEEDSRKRANFEQQLIGIVSHDLRNPLHAILLSSATMLKAGATLDDRTQRNLGRIRSSADRAVRLIRDLLDFTQARLGGGISISPKAMDLHEVVRTVVDEVEQVHPDRVIDFSSQGDGKGSWDADRIAQIASNLLSNALTYSQPGSRITAKTGGHADSVEFSVHNLGKPISEELRTRLFQPMERGHGGDTGGRSIGLGLFIVQHLVTAHGGTIEVQSSENEGTTFTVRLPRAPSAHVSVPRSGTS